MTGGLMQLVATGAQDIYLTGNPQITFFKSIYRRYTNFASEVIEKFFDGDPDFDHISTAKFSKDGDLINKMYIKIDFLPIVFDNTGTGKSIIANILLGLGPKNNITIMPVTVNLQRPFDLNMLIDKVSAIQLEISEDRLKNTIDTKYLKNIASGELIQGIRYSYERYLSEGIKLAIFLTFANNFYHQSCNYDSPMGQRLIVFVLISSISWNKSRSIIF